MDINGGAGHGSDLYSNSNLGAARDVAVGQIQSDIVTVSNMGESGGKHVPMHIDPKVVIPMPKYVDVASHELQNLPPSDHVLGGHDKDHDAVDKKDDPERPKLPPVPLLQLWRYSPARDKAILAWGCFCGVCSFPSCSWAPVCLFCANSISHTMLQWPPQHAPLADLPHAHSPG